MADYRTIVLFNLSKWENPNKLGTGYTLDVVMSVQDNVSKGVGVEKAYFKDGGEKRIPKMLQRKDFAKCKEHWPQILYFMDNPPPIPEVKPMETGGPIEEVPF